MQLSNRIQVYNGYQKDAFTYVPVLIVGAGESGVAMGCRLKSQLGFDQFRIYDRQSGMGGTWWINRYPGVACDVPTVFYSFSWAPYYTATKLYPDGKSIVDYLHRVAAQYEIQDKVQVNTDVSEVVYSQEEELWTVTLTHMAPGTGDLGAKDRVRYMEEHGEDAVYLRRETVKAKVVISCVGGLVEPRSWPENIPGNQDFKGEIFHSARWREDVDLNGKHVVVVGTGCTSAQVVPSILKEPYNVKSLTQLMRSPPWVVPMAQEPFGKENFAKYAPTVFSWAPILGNMLRLLTAAAGEATWFEIFGNTEKHAENRKKNEKKMLARMKRLAPEKYHEILTPNYSIGCKRRIFDPGWYESMNSPKFRLTTQKLSSVTATGVKLGPGRAYPPMDAISSASTAEEEIPADVIILANGFDTTVWLHPLSVVGKGGKAIHDVWRARGGPQAYLGAAMDGFPNFFMIFGPNTTTGHSSVIMASENMVELVIGLLRPLLKGDVSTIEVKEEAEREFTRNLQRDLKDTVFMSGGCSSWYMDENGWNSTVYPRSQIDFWYRCRFPDLGHWSFGYTPQGLFRQRLRRALRFSALTAAVLLAYWVRRGGGNDVNAWRTALRENVRKVLGAFVGLVQRAADGVVGLV